MPYVLHDIVKHLPWLWQAEPTLQLGIKTPTSAGVWLGLTQRGIVHVLITEPYSQIYLEGWSMIARGQQSYQPLAPEELHHQLLELEVQQPDFYWSQRELLLCPPPLFSPDTSTGAAWVEMNGQQATYPAAFNPENSTFMLWLGQLATELWTQLSAAQKRELTPLKDAYFAASAKM